MSAQAARTEAGVPARKVEVISGHPGSGLRRSEGEPPWTLVGAALEDHVTWAPPLRPELGRVVAGLHLERRIGPVDGWAGPRTGSW